AADVGDLLDGLVDGVVLVGDARAEVDADRSATSTEQEVGPWPLDRLGQRVEVADLVPLASVGERPLRPRPGDHGDLLLELLAPFALAEERKAVRLVLGL